MVATQTPSAARGGDPRAAAGNAASAEILKSPQDKRLYRRIVLANGLEALLISDPEMAHSLAEDEQQDDDDEHDEGEGGGSDDEVLPALDAVDLGEVEMASGCIAKPGQTASKLREPMAYRRNPACSQPSCLSCATAFQRKSCDLCCACLRLAGDG